MKYSKEQLIDAIKAERKVYKKQFPTIDQVDEIVITHKNFPSLYMVNKNNKDVWYEDVYTPYNMDDINKMRAWIEFIYTALRRNRKVYADRITDEEIVCVYRKSNNTYLVFIIDKVKHGMKVRYVRSPALSDSPVSEA